MRLRNIKGSKEFIQASPFVVQNPESYKGRWCDWFHNNNPIHIEIGMGKGQFIIENAKRYPNINFIGIEKYDSILALALKKINIELPNLVMLRLDAFNIDSIFKEEIDTIYLNFTDPWPKKRHAKRRLTSPEFLKKYDLIFKNNNHIVMKTDNKDLFSYSIKTLNNHGYYINHITFDLEKEKDSLNIMTEYEEKFTKLNNPIYKIDVIKGKK